MTQSQVKSLIWFRDDLRLFDNPALATIAASHSSTSVCAIYILDEQSPPLGGASRWWLHQSLSKLSAALKQKFHLNLYVCKGNPVDILPDLVRRYQFQNTHWNRAYDPHSIERDRQIKTTLQRMGCEVRSFSANLLHEPWEVTTKSDTPFKVFTPFWRQMRGLKKRALYQVPNVLTPAEIPENQDISTLGLIDGQGWSKKLIRYWNPGESAGEAALSEFCTSTLKGYGQARDYPAHDATSKLSPYLRFGEISPLHIWYHLDFVQRQNPQTSVDGEKFLSELAWRDFSYSQLFYHPTIATDPIQPRFQKFGWRDNEEDYDAWCHGKTGYPIVDAGMRQLWQTGYMHNRVRMIVASFLVKDLLIPWQKGAAWFWDTLVDADPANNNASWQWVAGCGCDAAPFFRIFNPVTQGQKFDPDGDYIRQWVPELSNLSNRFIHCPWQADSRSRLQAGVTLGQNYPSPIIDHTFARNRALEHFQLIRS